MKKGTLAIIKLIPDIIRDEKLNIGLVYHSPEDEFIKIKFTHKLHRVKAFYDEMDMDFYKIFTQTIYDEFTPSFFNNLDVSNVDLIKNLSYNYSNLFYFDLMDINIKEDKNLHFDDLFKTLVYFDEPINNRLTQAQRNKIIAETYYSNNNFELSYLDKIVGNFNEHITFDFKINDIYIKSFVFKPTNIRQMIDQTKIWIFNTKEIQKEIIFVVEDYVKDLTSNELIKNLNRVGKVYLDYNSKELLDYLESKQSTSIGDNISKNNTILA